MIDIFFDESVFAFILVLKSGKFQLVRKSNTLVTLYWFLLWGVHAPYPNMGVEYCLFDQRYSRTSEQINESAPHFLFTLTHIGVGWINIIIMRILLFFIVCMSFISCTSSRYVNHVSYQSVRMIDEKKHALSSLRDIPPTATIAICTSISEEGTVDVHVYNLSDSTMTIDRAQSFLVTIGGQHVFYNPEITSRTTSQTSSKGLSVNVGAVTGALGLTGPLQGLLNGVNVGGSKGVGSATTTYNIDQQIVHLAPHSHMRLAEDIYLGDVGMNALASDRNNTQIATISPNDSKYIFGICIAYSVDRQKSYKNFESAYYINSWITIPVRQDRKFYYPNEALRQLYGMKPDALQEKFYLMYFGRNRKMGYVNLPAFIVYK